MEKERLFFSCHCLIMSWVFFPVQLSTEFPVTKNSNLPSQWEIQTRQRNTSYRWHCVTDTLIKYWYNAFISYHIRLLLQSVSSFLLKTFLCLGIVKIIQRAIFFGRCKTGSITLGNHSRSRACKEPLKKFSDYQKKEISDQWTHSSPLKGAEQT